MDVIWFVDLTPRPLIPIKRRAVLSSVKDIHDLGRQSCNGGGNIGRIVPDPTGCRRWVRASSAHEALRRAQDDVM